MNVTAMRLSMRGFAQKSSGFDAGAPKCVRHGFYIAARGECNIIDRMSGTIVLEHAPLKSCATL